MDSVLFPIGPCVVALVTAAAASDLHSRRIPNWLVATGLIVALPVQWAVHGAVGGIQTWFLGALTGGLFFLPGYLLRVVGAGDVKLTAAVGAFCGATGVLEIALVACAIGGLWALVALIQRRRIKAGWTGTLSMLMVLASGPREVMRQGESLRAQSLGKLPYGVAIAVGTVCVLLASV